MTTPQARRFDARIEVFAEVRACVEHFCGAAQIPSRTTSVLVLMLEELFTNTVLHGYGRAGVEPENRCVWLTLNRQSGLIEALYEDGARAHNPFARTTAPDYSGPAESWRVGGLGVLLVTHYARDVQYERSDGRNRTRFTLEVPGSGD